MSNVGWHGPAKPGREPCRAGSTRFFASGVTRPVCHCFQAVFLRGRTMGILGGTPTPAAAGAGMLLTPGLDVDGDESPLLRLV